MATKARVIDAGFRALEATRLHRLLGPLTRGVGAILAFHRVAYTEPDLFAPNRALEVSPDFLAEILQHLRREQIEVLRLDEVPKRLRDGGRRFVALTFDDGYRDNVSLGLPVLERFEAPFTVFATTGFLDRTARLWWIGLESALRDSDRIDRPGLSMPTVTPAEKQAAFRALRDRILAAAHYAPEPLLDGLDTGLSITPSELVKRLCLDWTELKRLAAHPLVTIGCHTLSHPRLAALPIKIAREEIGRSRDLLASRLGVPIRHFAYPYGSVSDAGPREFAMARDLGFDTAVTTRPGVLAAGYAGHLTALPRLAVDGRWQSLAAFDALLSGLPTWLWNRGRSMDVG